MPKQKAKLNTERQAQFNKDEVSFREHGYNREAFVSGVRGGNLLVDCLSSSQAPEVNIRGEVPPKEISAEIRLASDQEFTKAHRKTSTVHAGLFRRLAE